MRKLKRQPFAPIARGQIHNRDQAIKKIISQSRTTGRLNLSNQGLKAVPQALWEQEKEAGKGKSVDLSFDRRDDGDTNWWEVVDLTRLSIADNMLDILDPRISSFQALVILDVHNNHLKALPDEIVQLINLSILNLSGNAMTYLPEGLFSLPITELNLSNNNFSELSPLIGNLGRLSTLDVSRNNLSVLPQSLQKCSLLTSLNLAKNSLATLGPADFTSLAELDASDNVLMSLFAPNAETLLPALQRLDLRRNKLPNLPPHGEIIKLPALRELYCSYNMIKSIKGGFLIEAINLQTVDIANNDIVDFPVDILALKELKRFDMQNNAISRLPPELGLLEGLSSFLYSGNPLKGLPTGSTSQMLRHLRNKIADAPSSAVAVDQTNQTITPSSREAASRTVDLSQRSLSELNMSVFDELGWKPSTLILHHNAFTSVPNCVYDLAASLSTLILSHNRIKLFPVQEMPNLKFLDLSSNLLTTLNEKLIFPRLLELNINNNRITSLPRKLPFPKLETLLISANAIEEIDADTFLELPDLRVLDLSDNALRQIPPRLGLCQLRVLGLTGNIFKVPRRQILEKGTDGILAYLKERIPADK